MSEKTLLLSDSVHINEKNFKSFLSFFRQRQIKTVIAAKVALPIDAFGNYAQHHEILEPTRSQLAALDKDALQSTERHGIRLFSVCSAETLSLAVTRDADLLSAQHASDAQVFEALWLEHRELLLDNLAAAAWWVNHWRSYLRSVPRLAYVAVFSGSLTYARVLLEVMKFQPARCFVLESFFTGAHFYCEERYTPIANSSDLRLATVRNALAGYPDRSGYEAKRNAARRVLEQIRNKNVTQPEARHLKVFKNQRPTLLLLGQVMNDFSLLDSAAGRFNALAFYRELIESVLGGSDWNVLFKAHPWERQKANLMRPATLEALERAFGDNPRVACVEHHALADAFHECGAVVCLNSQSGIEAAMAGFKPIQFGGAFWGGNGFSHDWGLEDVGSVCNLLGQRDQLRLDLQAFDHLETWLVTCLDRWLVEEAEGRQSEARLKQIFHEIGNLPAAAAQKPSTGPAEPPPGHPPQPREGSTLARLSTPARPPTAGTQMNGVSLYRRRLRKLWRQPKEFFRDSRNPLLQRLGTWFISGTAR